MPTGASDVWQAYASAWHPVTLGSDTMAHPSTLSWVCCRRCCSGMPSWVVPVVLVAGPPSAGLLAYQVDHVVRALAAASAVDRRRLRPQPSAFAATAQGRWTTVLVRCRAAAGGGRGRRGRSAGWAPRVGQGAAAVARAAHRRALGSRSAAASSRCCVAVALAIWVSGRRARLRRADHARWSGRGAAAVVAGGRSDPAMLLAGAGRALARDRAAVARRLLRPGRLVVAAVVDGVGLRRRALAAAFGLVGRAGARRLVVVGFAIAWALVLEAIAVTPTTSAFPSPRGLDRCWCWRSRPVGQRGGGSAGAPVRLSRVAFTWRQPALAVVTALAVVSPLIWGVTWLGRGPANRWTAGRRTRCRHSSARSRCFPSRSARWCSSRSRAGSLTRCCVRAVRSGATSRRRHPARLASLDDVVSDLASGARQRPCRRAGRPSRAVHLGACRRSTTTSKWRSTRRRDCCGSPTPVTPRSGGCRRTPAASGLLASKANVGAASEDEDDPAAAESRFRLATATACSSSPNSPMTGGSATESADGQSRELPTRATSDWASRFVVGRRRRRWRSSSKTPRHWMLWGQLVAVAVLVLVAFQVARADEEAV